MINLFFIIELFLDRAFADGMAGGVQNSPLVADRLCLKGQVSLQIVDGDRLVQIFAKTESNEIQSMAGQISTLTKEQVRLVHEPTIRKLKEADGEMAKFVIEHYRELSNGKVNPNSINRQKFAKVMSEKLTLAKKNPEAAQYVQSDVDERAKRREASGGVEDANQIRSPGEIAKILPLPGELATTRDGDRILPSYGSSIGQPSSTTFEVSYGGEGRIATIQYRSGSDSLVFIKAGEVEAQSDFVFVRLERLMRLARQQVRCCQNEKSRPCATLKSGPVPSDAGPIDEGAGAR